MPLFSAYSFTFSQRDRFEPTFSGVMAYAPPDVDVQIRLVGQNGPRDAVVRCVTSEFFETMGVAPAMGRSFIGERRGSAEVVLSNRMWRTEQQSAVDVVGSRLDLLGRPFTVVGVMPESFDFPVGTDVWVFMGTLPISISQIEFVGRLRAGVQEARAATDLAAIGNRNSATGEGNIGKDGPVLQPLNVFLRSDRRPLSGVLSTASILFLLLTCAGAANLLLVQGVRRRPEILTRLALGAGRWYLVWQLMIETLFVVGAGSVFATWLSIIVGRWLRTQLPEMQEGQVFVPATVIFVVVVAVAATIICGLAPALHATRPAEGRSVAGGPKLRSRSVSSREWLTGVELALALVLLISTGALLRSLSNRLNQPLGFDARGVAVLQSVLPRPGDLVDARAKFYRDNGMSQTASYGPRSNMALMQKMQKALEPEERSENVRDRQFFQEAERRLRGLNSAISIGVIQPAPLTSAAVRAAASPTAVYAWTHDGVGQDRVSVSCVVGRASPSAFDVLGLPLLAGRPFTSTDIADEAATQEAIQFASLPGRHQIHQGTAIVNIVLAHELWPNQSAVGQRFNDRGSTVRTVVGVVSNFQLSGYDSAPIPVAYYPFTGTSAGAFVLRLPSDSSVDQFADEANRILADFGPGTMRLQVKEMAGGPPLTNLRIELVLLACISVLATIVAGTGVHAAATAMSDRWAKEMAIRTVLGAQVMDIRGLALWRALRPAALAVPAGLCGGWLAARQLAAFLFQVNPSDRIVFGLSVALLLVVSVIAALPSARRVSTVDSWTTLKCQ
jgi:ABC-type antimicrobial peptide transport system permease subunit